MRKTEHGVSFSVAAKHLFRHLHDPAALRANPLVRHIFAPNVRGPRRRDDDSVALAHIHRLVREAAERFLDADTRSGDDERAARRHAIVVRNCLEGRAIGDVAAELGISYKHCYRERAEICLRIAHDIAVRGDEPSLQYRAEFDEFRFLLNRAKRRAASGDLAGALDEARALAGSTPTVSGKIEALRIDALVCLRSGEIERARAAHAKARQLSQSGLEGESDVQRSVAHANVDLLACDLAFEGADTKEALRLAESATKHLERWHENASAAVEELYVESLYEFGAALWNRGCLEQSYENVARAQARLERARTISSHLRSRVTAGLWKVRNHLLVGSKTWYPAWQRADGLTAAFHEAYASGALFDAADALVALVQCHAFAGHDAEALRAARFTVWLASQQPSARIRTQTAIQIAMVLLWTRHWEYGLSLLGDPSRPCDAYHAELTQYFALERAFRGGAYSDAWRIASSEGLAKRYPALRLRSRLVASAAAHELGRRREAHRLIEEALPAAERLGSAPILRDAYHAAARVTGDAHFRRQASEVARALTA